MLNSSVATPEFYRKLVAWAKKYHVGIISDFAYGAIGFDGQAPVSFMETPGAKDVGIEFYTFSKTFNMAGWRIAFAVGNADIIEALNLIQDHLFVSLFPALQEAAIDALTLPQRDDAIAEIVGRYEERRNAFINAAEKIGMHLLPRVLSMLGCRFQRIIPVKALQICYWTKLAWQ